MDSIFLPISNSSTLSSKLLGQFQTHQLQLVLPYYWRVFHTSVSWQSFTRIWITVSLLRSPGLFSVFWLTSTMLQFGRCRVVRFLTPPIPLSSLYEIVPRIPITMEITCSIAFLVLWQGPSTCRSFRFLWFSLCQLSLGLVFWLG